MLPTKPTYAIWVWWNGERTMFSVIEDMTIGYAKTFYEYHKAFFGKSATVFVFFNDYDLRNEDLLEAANRFMHGDYIRFDVDLYNLLVASSKGIDLTAPRH